MKTVEVNSSEIHNAYRNWMDFCHAKNIKWHQDAFRDFLDPVRQTDLYVYSEEESGGFTTTHSPIEVTEQVARRIKLLTGPHHYAYLMANIERFDHAHKSWGKKYDNRNTL